MEISSAVHPRISALINNLLEQGFLAALGVFTKRNPTKKAKRICPLRRALGENTKRGGRLI